MTENDQLEADVKTIERTMLQLGWATHRRLHQELSKFNLTVSQFAALRALQGFENGCTMSELAEAARQISAAMTGIVDRLVERGVIDRQRDPADRRSVRISLTEDGAELLETIRQQKRLRLRQFLAELSHTERQDFVRMIGKYLKVVYS